jgi:hypothetical protein
MSNKTAAIVALLMIIALSVAGCATNTSLPTPASTITRMIDTMNATNMYGTISDLQSIYTRVYGSAGNKQAQTYLYDKLSANPRLRVHYEAGNFSNIIATLPGTDPSAGIVVVGAHYDSRSVNLTDVNLRAPGAADNAAGVAVVCELARVMSQHRFIHTIDFALWNAEEQGMIGSRAYADAAAANHVNVSLYLNYDGACYDPDNRFVLDLLYNNQSAWAAQMMANDNSLFGINFTLIHNNCTRCSSDQLSFWSRGYSAVMPTAERPGPEHTASDTLDYVSVPYVLKNSQLGLALLAQTAEIRAAPSPTPSGLF